MGMAGKRYYGADVPASTGPHPDPMDDPLAALAFVVEWWDGLPPRLRQDIEGSGFEPGCIARARRLSRIDGQSQSEK